MKKLLSLVAALTLSLCLFAGCNNSESTVSTDGSTSMSKIIGALGEAFENEYPDVTFTYNPTGSGTGITAVLEGTCDIGLSSRKLKDSEISQGLVETILAYDGIAVIVNPSNTISDLSLETLAKIYTGEITDWAQVGGKSGDIVLIGREAGSGTREGFESITDTEGKCAYRQQLTSTGDVITAVAQNSNAIGYTSLASVKDNVKAISVNGVAPTESTIRDSSYPIQRPFILVTKSGTQLSDNAQAFMDFATSSAVHKIILQVGCVPSN